MPWYPHQWAVPFFSKNVYPELSQHFYPKVSHELRANTTSSQSPIIHYIALHIAQDHSLGIQILTTRRSTTHTLYDSRCCLHKPSVQNRLRELN
jgi:hypothetical protein